jgi:hypothetical protein
MSSIPAAFLSHAQLKLTRLSVELQGRDATSSVERGWHLIPIKEGEAEAGGMHAHYETLRGNYLKPDAAA